MEPSVGEDDFADLVGERDGRRVLHLVRHRRQPVVEVRHLRQRRFPDPHEVCAPDVASDYATWGDKSDAPMYSSSLPLRNMTTAVPFLPALAVLPTR